jgi:membrane protein
MWIIWAVLKRAVAGWSSHRSGRLGAALAYYSVFSMGPLLLVVVAVAGLFFGRDAVSGSLTDEFRSLLGPSGAAALEAMLAGAAVEQSGHIAAIVGGVLLLVAAVGVVAQLKDAMNTIWNVPDESNGGLFWYIRNYAMSFAGILALGFLLTVSLIVSAGLAALSEWTGSGEAIAWQGLNLVASLAIISTLFAMLFKWFPDADVAWRDVWPGAVLTAVLFDVGKQLIGWYVGTQSFESTYGAAASIVVLLVWVYYSAQIVLFGAEVTRSVAEVRRGAGSGGAATATSASEIPAA